MDKGLHYTKGTINKNMNIQKISALLFILGLMAVSYGCGEDEAVHTNAPIQGESENQSDESQSEDNAEEAGEEALGEEAADPLEEQITVEEPLKSQLTAELLEENDLDTGVVENARITKGCTFDLPEGFEASEDVEGMYVTGRYPIDASTIYYTVVDQDMAMQLMTEEKFKEYTEESFRETGENMEVMIDSFEQTKIQGYPVFRIRWHCQAGDVKVSQLAYAVNADKSYVITYSQTGDYDWMEEYEASAETIRVEY